MLQRMTIRLIYVHLLEPFNLCQMPTRGHLGPNLDFHVNCNISFVLYYKIFRQDLCRFNDTTALVPLISSIIAHEKIYPCTFLTGLTWTHCESESTWVESESIRPESESTGLASESTEVESESKSESTRVESESGLGLTH